MITFTLKRSKDPVSGKRGLIAAYCFSVLLFCLMVSFSPVSAQAILFDFDNAPLYTSLPIDQTAGGITAHLSATGQGYSIQEANVLGFTPPGFAGHILYPNSIYLSDLHISYDHILSDFSIMYSCQELGCDDAATMRVTAYMNGIFIGTNTRTASKPGTWPVDTLRCSFPQGFDSIVVHYDSHPPTCQDYGTIYLADNMRVTPVYPASVLNPEILVNTSVNPNPVSQSTTMSFTLLQPEIINVTISDIRGRLIRNLFNGHLSAGKHQIKWVLNDDPVDHGIYFLNLTGANMRKYFKLVIVKQ